MRRSDGGLTAPGAAAAVGVPAAGAVVAPVSVTPASVARSAVARGLAVLALAALALPCAVAADEIVGLDGRVLQAAAPADDFAARQEELLAEALHRRARAPNDPATWIWVGRRQAYLGRFQAAIDTYDHALEAFPGEPRLLRHRGHRYITVRRLALAIADLERAVEAVAGTPDEVEPDGLPNERGIPTSTLHTNIWYHLGLARYLQRDFAGAADAYRRCRELATHPDMEIAATYWLYLATRRAGDGAAAAEILAGVEPGLELIENDGYYELLRAFAGDLEPADLLARAAADRGQVAYPTTAYGVGAWTLLGGDPAAAERVFRAILDSPEVTAFGYIAAEAEMVGSDAP